MLAAYYSELGAASAVLKVGEVPTPSPGEGEVRVRLEASGVNPSDWKARGGVRGGAIAWPKIIPHSDGAGVIDLVGPGVNLRIGNRVWVWNGQWRRPFGTAAEYIVLPERQAVRLPDIVSFHVGACLGIPGFTALQAVNLANLTPGMEVLIIGGAGAVGHYAIQFAKRRGARVLTTVSSAIKGEHASRAGADEIINYRLERLGPRVKALTREAGVDVVIDLDAAVNGPTYPDLLKPHGAAVIFGTSETSAALPILWLMRNSIRLQPFLVYDMTREDRDAALAEFEPLLNTNQLIHTVAAVFPLNEIARAHELGESGSAIGTIILSLR